MGGQVTQMEETKTGYKSCSFKMLWKQITKKTDTMVGG
jgi:hypothetical protein